MKLPDDMLPEEKDPRYEELITLLQQANLNPLLVDPTERAQILSQARARLFQTDPEVSKPEEMPVLELSELASFPSKPKALADKQHRGRRLIRLVNELAAVLVVLALIGSALLGFSVFLAGRLGVLPIFNGNSTVTPTTSIVYDTVPDLRNLHWSDALSAAKSAGFQLKSYNGTSGIVKSQSYDPGAKVPQNTVIYVTMEPEPAKTATIPPFTRTTTLASYEALLRSYGFNNLTTKSDGADPNLLPNTVSRVVPAPGISYDVTKLVTIYVKNYTSVTPVASPTPSPITGPTPV